MAGIRKRGPAQYQVQVRRRGWPNQSATFETKAEAEAWGREVESEMDKGTFVCRKEAESTSLSEALDRYMKEVTPHKKGAKREEGRIKQLKRHKLASHFLSNIHSKHIASYRDERLAEGISPSTYQKEHALLSHVFTVCRKDWGLEVRNPCSDVRKPRVKNARENRLSRDEEVRLLESFAGRGALEMRAIVVLAIETAMRRSEISSLSREQIERDKRIAYLSETKNGDSRAVPLSARALEAIESLPVRIDGRLFGIHVEEVSKKFRKAADSIGRTDLKFHDLRHEATSRFFESGNFRDLEIAAITGHKTLAMLKRYAHFKVEELARRLG